jgi:hypothetical protein
VACLTGSLIGLEQASELTGDSKTDTINRALQVCAYLEEIGAKGARPRTFRTAV